MTGWFVHVSPPFAELRTDTLPHGPPFQAAFPYVNRPSIRAPFATTRIIPPIEPENDVSVKSWCGASHVTPPFVERAKNVWDLYDFEWAKPLSDACVLPPGVRSRSHVA